VNGRGLTQAVVCCLHVLCFVAQVDDSGKVSRLRKQCPQCGPGIFMATHFDRVYCGKCTTTYLVSSSTGWQEAGAALSWQVSAMVATPVAGALLGCPCYAHV
jgi:small subunit ribosomal protein S27Ae